MHVSTAGVTCFLSTRHLNGRFSATGPPEIRDLPAGFDAGASANDIDVNACHAGPISVQRILCLLAARFPGGFFDSVRSVRVKALMLTCLAAALAGCAGNGGRPDLPYPAFVDSDSIPDAFLAALPGVRAKLYSTDMRTEAMSARVELPPDWTGTTGAAPGKALELFVLAGSVEMSGFELRPGGYAYVPPGSLGFNLSTREGAQVLWFLDEVPEAAVIRSPIVLNSGLVDWDTQADGTSRKLLRQDPGSGATTWLVRIDADPRAWRVSSATREGYLVVGQHRLAECWEGEAHVAEYETGNYFRRPAGTPAGGPEAAVIEPSVWFFREREESEVRSVPACPAAGSEPAQ